MKELKQQLVGALLVIVTVAAIVAAAINLQQQTRFHLPDDGVTWLDQSQGQDRNSAVVAGFLAPTLFLHFCFVFPEPQKWIRARGAAVLVYLPGAILLATHLGFVYGWVTTAAPLLEMRWLLDRIWLGFLCAMYLAGALV